MANINNGSLQNHLMSTSNNPVKPEVGMGVTAIYYTDRRPYTIIEIVSDREIKIQADRVIRTDSNGMSDCQSYRFESNPEGEIRGLKLKTSSKRPNGIWVEKGSSINSTRYLIGTRKNYFDFSF